MEILKTCLCILLWSPLCSRGNDFSNGVFLTGKIKDINNKKVVKLTCHLSKEPILHVVEFFVNRNTVDSVRLHGGKCYNSIGECNSKICTCSKDGSFFTWIFYQFDKSRTYTFGCQVRILDEKNITVKTTATLQFDGTDFLVQEPEHENVAINTREISDPDGNDNYLTHIGAGVSSIVVGLAVTITFFIVHCYRKLKTENGTNEIETGQPLIPDAAAATYIQAHHKVRFHSLEKSNSQNTQRSSPQECKKLSERTTELSICSTSEEDVQQKSEKLFNSNLKKEHEIDSDQKCTIDSIFILDDNQLLIFDKENNCLKVLCDEKWHSITDFKSKLIGVTYLYKNLIAAIFSDEERIQFIQISSDKINYPGKEIDLKTLGKPFNIAYNKNHFAVRIGLGLDGRFVILNTDGKTLHIIWNSQMRFGDFNETSVEVAFILKESCMFISLFDKNAVYCVNFKGDILWHTPVSCPKGILYVNSTDFFRERNIILACQNPNVIYQIASESGKLTLLIEEKDGINVPKCIGYKETETEYLLYTDTNTEKILEFSLTTKNL